MNVSESFEILKHEIKCFLERKKANPYYCCNYKKPLKAKQILKILTK